jgi:hypothetical protein
MDAAGVESLKVNNAARERKPAVNTAVPLGQQQLID